VLVCPFEDGSAEAGGSGFAVGAGDGERFALEEARGQLDFADDGQAKLAHLHELGRIERHAGADDDQILPAKGEEAVATGLDRNALLDERGNVFAKRLGAANVRNGDLRAAAAQKKSSG